jgi:hypothetical protein
MAEEVGARLRALQTRLNQARHANNTAASLDLVRHRTNHPTPKIDPDEIFDIPLRFLRVGPSGPSSDDHLEDADVRRYLRDLEEVPQSIYDDYAERRATGQPLPHDWRPRDDLAQSLAARLRKKKDEMRRRNLLAADYDISGKYHVDFINDKNKRFNKRLAREYNQFTEDLRASLERGGGA